MACITPQRPVYRCQGTNQKWCRLKTSLRFIKDGDSQQLFFEHSVECNNDKIYFSFTYPYSYSSMISELDELDSHVNEPSIPGSIFYKRELLTNSCDGRRIDLLTISSVDGMSKELREPLLSGLFPDCKKPSDRVTAFPDKEIIFISARVHAGEVPAQHTFKGILDLLMDENDLCGKELRARYVFKLIPMLNPDGKFLIQS
jgi:cytosolic carboxypeptidase protein 5